MSCEDNNDNDNSGKKRTDSLPTYQLVVDQENTASGNDGVNAGAGVGASAASNPSVSVRQGANQQPNYQNQNQHIPTAPQYQQPYGQQPYGQQPYGQQPYGQQHPTNTG